MAETQSWQAFGLNCAGSANSAGQISPIGAQRNFNVASVSETSAGVYAIQPTNPIPRTMGQIAVEVAGAAGLSWGLVSWDATTGLITIRIATGAGVLTAAPFDFMVFQTNLDSAGGT